MMFSKISLHKILFFDVETVSSKVSYNALSPSLQALWTKKHQNIKMHEEQLPEESYSERSAIYAEFGKIVCISCGFVADNVLRVKSFYGDDEKQLLTDFANMLQQSFNQPAQQFLCGHNIKEFDVPYVCRRMMINQIALPSILNISGKKPWEVNFLDTMQLWKFGDYKNFTSLELLAAIFDIPTPKDDIDGSMVSKVYWEEQNLERIKIYCEKDVITVFQLFQKLGNNPVFNENQIVLVD